MSWKYDYTTWSSPQGYFVIKVGLPNINVPAAAQPTIPEKERKAFVEKLEELAKNFKR